MLKGKIIPCAFLLLAIFARAQKPELVLPTIHTEPILDITFSGNGQYMASCAGKEIKLWEQKTGLLLKTIQTKLPISKIALSGDGSKLAVGTFCGVSEFLESGEGTAPNINTEVQVWDLVSGKMLRTLKALGAPIRIQQVDISDDGQLVLALYSKKVTCWDTNSGLEIFQVEGKGSVHFSPDGAHFLLAEQEGLFWVDSKTGAKEKVGEESCSAYVCAGDFVVALTESGVLKRWNWRNKTVFPDLKPVLEGFKTDGFNVSIRFSSDGKDLGLLWPDENHLFYKKLDTQTGKASAKLNLGESEGNWVNLSPDLQHYFTIPQVDVADVRAGMSAYSLSKGQFSYSFGLKLLETTTFSNMFFPPDFRVYNEGKLILVKRDTSLSMQMPNALFLPERGEIICGVESDSVKNYSENGMLREDKRWRLTCKDHLSYELSDAKTGQLVATLLLADAPLFAPDGTIFQTASSRIWAVTTPSGLFDASPEMMGNLHYVVGREIIELDQLKERYYQPGLLGKILGFDKGTLRTVSAFDKVSLYPEISANIEKTQLNIQLSQHEGGTMGKLSLFVNGKLKKADINPERLQTLRINLDEFNNFYRSDTVNTIGLVAYNGDNWLKSRMYELPYQASRGRGESTGAAKPSACGSVKPNLFLIVVGTSQYNDASKSLSFPDQDAAEMANALSSTGKELFGNNVQLKLLSTAGGGVEVSSKANIQAAFQAVAQQATPCDVVVAYFSGHGTTWGKDADKTNFYYLTKDITNAKLSDEAVRTAYAVSDAELTQWLSAIPAQKQVLILDACNSGKAAENFGTNGQKDLNSDAVIAFELMKDRTGTFILTGSAADMVSYESNKYGQGLLTYSLLEGMSGTALKDGRYVDIMTLFQHSRDLVPLLAKSIGNVQNPVIAAPREASSFPVGIKDARVKIELAQPKPVVIRSNFQDKVKFKDGLGLTRALNDYFHAQNVKGAQAQFVFYDIDEYQEGFSINGNYSVSGETVTVNGGLFKGENAIGAPFQVTGTKDPAELVKLILKEVGPRMK